jgi:hypothetical protein
MMRAIHRLAIPVDDQWHTIALHGPIVHVATREHRHVEIWFIDNVGLPGEERTFRVYGTGQPDLKGTHVGTAITPDGALVWHLMECA